eukprot:m.93636 g.93636  ORF g.93636 m.93636 type:complete len:418 (+) comp14708_c0_seq2:213-1466(+)
MVLCCALECAACALCSCCCSGFRMLSSAGVRLVYAVLFMLSIAAAWCMRSDFMEQTLEKAGNATHGIFEFNCDGTGPSDCFGVMATLRVVLGVVFYHSLLLLLTVRSQSRTDIQGSIHSSWWPIKFLVLCGLVVACFFMPDDSIAPFYWVCFVGGIIFIVWHTVVLLDGSYTWAQTWRQAADNNRGYVAGLLFFTFSFLVGIIVLTVFMFLYFTRESGCGLHKFVISFNLILVVMAMVVSILPKVQEHNASSGLLQASLLGLFQTYLVWSGLSSRAECNNFSNPTSAQHVPVFSGMALLFLIIIWHTTNADRRKNSKDTEPTQWNQVYVEEENEDAAKSAAPEYSYTIFHLFFILAACYAAMIITSWNNVKEEDDLYRLEQSDAAFWVQVILSWITWGLLTWAAVAPCCFPDREFSR